MQLAPVADELPTPEPALLPTEQDVMWWNPTDEVAQRSRLHVADDTRPSARATRDAQSRTLGASRTMPVRTCRRGVRVSSLLIKDGIVVSGTESRRADVLIEDGRIASIASDSAAKADRILSADRCYVLPGGIDVHTHPVYRDDVGALSVTAAHGGITTVIHYAYAKPGQGLMDTLRAFRADGESSSIVDFALHGGLFDPKNQAGEIPNAVAAGVASHKVFMTYAKLGWMTDDYQLMRTLDILARCGGLGMVHAENGLATDYLEDRALEEGLDPKEAFIATRPDVLEAEATNRAIAMAQVAGCPLYIVHVTSRLGLQAIARARGAGQRVYAETCPQYLTLTNEDLLAQGALLKIGPPLRTGEDRDALWSALAAGGLDTVGSDHAPKDKARADDFFAAPFGSPQIETMLPLVYDGGVASSRLTIERMVRVTSENPAKVFGLYPRKGTIQIGSDADIVLLDPTAEYTITHETQHSNALYTAYEGRPCTGRPIVTIRRGEVLVENGQLTRPSTRARFLPTRIGATLADLR